MSGILAFAYGLGCYALFFVTFLYTIGFVANVGVPRTIDSGVSGGLWPALAVDLGLLTLFAVQHSIMARPSFKAWWSGLLPRSTERSTFVLASTLILILLMWQWRPLTGQVWAVDEPILVVALWALYGLGWGTVLLGSFMISHTHLFGLSQVWARMRGRAPREPEFQIRWLYRYVRHPLMLGFLVAFWATPVMSLGHLLFAAGATGYIVLATLALEERDLERFLGEPYRRYRREVPAFLPRPGRVAAPAGVQRPGEAR